MTGDAKTIVRLCTRCSRLVPRSTVVCPGCGGVAFERVDLAGEGIMRCCKCGEEMRIAHRNDNQILWKCSSCGHMTLVQEIDRNDVGRRKAGG